MSHWRSVDDLNDAELRRFASQLAEEIQELRRVMSLLCGLVLSDADHFPDRMPEEVRKEVLLGLEAYCDHAMDLSEREEKASYQYHLERHRAN